jgi:hypothetical protein
MRRRGPRARVYARYAAEVLVSSRWNSESVGSLSVEELRQLRENAVRLGAGEVAGLCDSALAAHGPKASSGVSSRRENSKLVPRRSAFRMLGVHLNAGMSSWGGVRQSDGIVVLSLWADDVRSENGGCSCLLWAPNNKAGSRPWSDTPAGKERLEHCKLAVQKGEAEGFLVHGVRLKDVLPEERAHSVDGADPAVVIQFQVVQRGAEYWALWGSVAAAAAWK